MSKFAAIRLFPILATLALSFILSGVAHADQRCRDVLFTIINNFTDADGIPRDIRLTRIFYRDLEDFRTRTEQIPNFRLDPGESVNREETLEFVGNEEIGQMTVEFRARLPRPGNPGRFRWSNRLQSNPIQGPNPCRRFTQIEFDITEGN